MYSPIIPIKQNYYKPKTMEVVPWEFNSAYNLDLESISNFLALGFMLDDNTYFREIKTCKPATEYKINENKTTTFDIGGSATTTQMSDAISSITKEKLRK